VKVEDMAKMCVNEVNAAALEKVKETYKILLHDLTEAEWRLKNAKEQLAKYLNDERTKKICGLVEVI
jgi:hypothetical protein